MFEIIEKYKTGSGNIYDLITANEENISTFTLIFFTCNLLYYFLSVYKENENYIKKEV